MMSYFSVLFFRFYYINISTRLPSILQKYDLSVFVSYLVDDCWIAFNTKLDYGNISLQWNRFSLYCYLKILSSNYKWTLRTIPWRSVNNFVIRKVASYEEILETRLKLKTLSVKGLLKWWRGRLINFVKKWTVKEKKWLSLPSFMSYFMKEHDKVDIGKWLSITEKDCC